MMTTALQTSSLFTNGRFDTVYQAQYPVLFKSNRANKTIRRDSPVTVIRASKKMEQDYELALIDLPQTNAFSDGSDVFSSGIEILFREPHGVQTSLEVVDCQTVGL
ncbi:hypothetical protein WDW37_02010 [Bdellovibrionota bacterium FG-1]